MKFEYDTLILLYTDWCINKVLNVNNFKGKAALVV